MNRILEGFVTVDQEEMDKLLYRFKTMEGVKEFLSSKLESAIAEECMGIHIFAENICHWCEGKNPNHRFAHCSLECADAALAASKRIIA